MIISCWCCVVWPCYQWHMWGHPPVTCPRVTISHVIICHVCHTSHSTPVHLRSIDNERLRQLTVSFLQNMFGPLMINKSQQEYHLLRAGLIKPCIEHMIKYWKYTSFIFIFKWKPFWFYSDWLDIHDQIWPICMYVLFQKSCKKHP